MEPAVITVWKLWTVYNLIFAATAILSCIIKIRGLFKYTKWRHLKMSNLKLSPPGVKAVQIALAKNQRLVQMMQLLSYDSFLSL